MKKKIVELVSLMLLLSTTLTVCANDTAYPLKTQYPDGVEKINSSLLLNTKIQRPIENGFETRDEIESLTLDSQSNELVISEDAYSGKFALKIQKNKRDIIPIRETGYFYTGESITTDIEENEQTIMLDGSDICIQINNNKIMVSGTRAQRESVSVVVQKNNAFAYIDQTYADENGYFEFSFALKEKGTYQLSIGGSSSEALQTTVEIVSTGISEENSVPIVPAENMQMKCNYYTLMLKPMQNSETISFYAKVQKLDEDGNSVEEFALIKSDSDGDGIFKVGEDLSRGKWQSIQLNLTDIPESLCNGAASGLYMSGNQNSEWLFDDISSGYKKINETVCSLSDFAAGNVVYDGNGLRFADDKQNGNYNIGSMVVAAGVDVSDPISEINIKSKLQFGSESTVQQEENRKILRAVSLESEVCTVNDIGYDTAQNATSKKVQKIYCREDLPKIPSAKSMTIYHRPETEKRFRLILQAKTLDKTVSVKEEDGTETEYTLSKQSIYTNWYTGDIVLMGSVKLDNLIDNYMIEYESITGIEQDIVMHYQGNVTIDLKDFTTDDRTKVSYELVYEPKRTLSTEPMLELYEGDAETPYYATRANINKKLARQTVSHIIPKIKPNTKMRITNLLDGDYDEIRISDVNIWELLERDWNKKIDYADYALEYTKPGGTNTFSFEREEYAVVYPDIVGYVNTEDSEISWKDSKDSDSYDFAMYRILNLSKEPVSVKVSTTTIWLQYGLVEYIAPAYSILKMPPNDKVMLVDKKFYSETRYNSNNLHYKNIDGLSDGTFIAEENAIIYKNIYDCNRAYIYYFGTGINQKISNDELCCTSPDGTRLLLCNQDGEYYVFNRSTMQTEAISNISGKEFFFGVNNELFTIISGSLADTILYCYTINGAQEVHTFDDRTDNYYAFDSSGNYLLLIDDSRLYLYKNTNGMWNEVDNFSEDMDIAACCLSNDATTAYIEKIDNIVGNTIYAIDLNTHSSNKVARGNLLRVTEDNMLLFNDENGYYSLYNPLTDETYRIFNNTMSCFDIYYHPETNLVTGILANGSVFQHHFSVEQPEAKYALSFDGRNNWYAYSGGRWQIVSKQKMPNFEEMNLSGMTADTVNTIPASAYEKLYSDGNDILTVDVAIFMNSKLNNQTPVIENITVSTIDEDDSSGMFGIHLETYQKDDYRKINSLFPVENFGSDAECYYLLYLGNDWLYTYKDGKLIKVEDAADTLFEDMSTSWITFKQYGMNAQELRRIPGEVLSNLFVNEDYANTEFGVIYVVKTQNDDTENYTVTFRLSSSANFVTEEDIVVEITMNGGDVKIIKSDEFSITDIKNLLSWIEARQSGNGEVFYRLKNDKTQHFLNYYMINSISVYSGSEYNAQNAE